MSVGSEPSAGKQEESEQIFLRARKAFGIHSVRVGGKLFDVRENTSGALPFVMRTTFARVHAGKGQKFLVVPPLAGAFPVLLRDLVVELLRHGESVAVADWLDPRFVPLSVGRFGFRENILRLVEMIRAGGPDVHVVAVCQAVTPALAATALLAANEPQAAPRSLILMGGPIDPAVNPSAVAQRLASRPLGRIRDNLIEPAPPGFPGSGRRVYSRERQYRTFLGYLTRHMLHQRELFWKLLFDEGEDPLRFPFWTLISTLMDLTEEFLLEDIEAVFHQRAIVRRSLRVDGCVVDPRAVTGTAVMTIEGSDDDLAAPGQTRAAFKLIGGAPARRRRHLLVENCGHFSLFHGNICRRQVVPAIIDFVDGPDRRSEKKAGAASSADRHGGKK